MSEYAALVSIDWADQQHAVCLLDPTTGKREHAIRRTSDLSMTAAHKHKSESSYSLSHGGESN